MTNVHGGARYVSNVVSFGRIHLGLLQMSTDFRYLNMGIGFSVETPRWLLRCEPDENARCNIENACGYPISRSLLDQASELLDGLTERFALGPLKIVIEECIPEHIGLGSKTSLLCALLAAAAGSTGEKGRWVDWRHLTGRGGTSGIGVNVAVTGGLVLDTGHRETYREGALAPSRARQGHSLPISLGCWPMPDWPLILAYPLNAKRIYGEEESRFFNEVLPLRKDEVECTAGITLHELLPAVATGDFNSFTHALSRLQDVGFKQREWDIQDASVHRIRDVALDAGANCVALSSIGPTTVIFAEHHAPVLECLQRESGEGIWTICTTARNRGIEFK